MKKLFTLFVILVPLALLGSSLAQQTSADKFQKALAKEKAEGKLEEAIALYQKVVDKGEDDSLAAQAQLHIGMCYEKLGLEKAREAYEKVIERFPNQPESVRAAREKLAQLKKPAAERADSAFKIRLAISDLGSNFGTVSPDGRSLAITDPKSSDLAIRDIETGQIRRLTKNSSPTDGMFVFGRWSPDGKRIAFAWFNKDNCLDLRLIDTGGSEPRVLFQDKDANILPAGWSPDGLSILAILQRRNAGYQIVLVSAADGSVQVVKTSTKPIPSSPMNMSFSPDGKYIAYDAPQKDSSKQNDIFLLSSDGKQEVRLVEYPADDTFVGWVPKTNALLFASDRALSRDLWAIRTAEGRPLGEPALVKKDIGMIQPLGFSDSGSLYYGVGTYMVDIYEAGVDLEKGTITEPPKKLSQKFVGPFYYPCWSPDGKSLAYLAEKREAGKPSTFFICVRPDKGEERWVPVEIDANWGLDWSADGRSFFGAVRDMKGNQGLFKIDQQTGELTLLAKSRPDSLIKTIAVSPDGKSVFYAHFQWKAKLCNIIQRDLATGQEKEICRKESLPDITRMTISQDSRYLSFSTADALTVDKGFVIRIVDLADGKTRDILQGKLEFFTPHVWTPDGKSILYIKRTGDANKWTGELWQVLAAGGEPKRIGLNMESMGHLDLHPDGKRIVFTAGNVHLEVWAMENYLPKETGR